MMSDKGKHLIPEERNLEDRAYDLFGELLLERDGRRRHGLRSSLIGT